jgi:hypothetical protein
MRRIEAAAGTVEEVIGGRGRFERCRQKKLTR